MVAKPIVLGAEEGAVTRIPGETFVAKASGEATQGHLALAVGEWAPRHGTFSHRHPGSSESFYVLSGEFIIDIEDEEHNVGPGAFAYVPPGARHRVTNVGNEPARIIGFFTPAGPEKGFQAVRERAMQLGRLPDAEEIEQIMAEHGTVDRGPARMRFDDSDRG
jgi:mannose-6-phosphate isomerase-like protein (cupin superfamily)